MLRFMATNEHPNRCPESSENDAHNPNRFLCNPPFMANRSSLIRPHYKKTNEINDKQIDPQEFHVFSPHKIKELLHMKEL